MIERLLVTLRLFADEDRGRAAAAGEASRAAGDFLDAYRLIVDCPQYELGATARSALDDVRDAAEHIVATPASGRRADMAAAAAAARRSLAALGESPRGGPRDMVDGPRS